MAPASFGALAGSLLIGNFGNGHINAYNATTGEFIDKIRNRHGQVIAVDGLWSLRVGSDVSGANFGPNTVCAISHHEISRSYTERPARCRSPRCRTAHLCDCDAATVHTNRIAVIKHLLDHLDRRMTLRNRLGPYAPRAGRVSAQEVYQTVRTWLPAHPAV